MTSAFTAFTQKHKLWQRLEVVAICWLVLLYALMLVWPSLSGEPFPIPGVRKAIASTTAFVRWTQCLAIIGMGLWLLYKPSKQTLEGLAVYQGMACALMFTALTYFDTVFWGAYMVFNMAAHFRRTALKAREQESQNMRG